MLLNAGANGAAQDTHKRTPLYWAVKKGHIKTVEMLLNAGAPTEGEDMFGKTILARAFTNALREPYDNRHATIINLLLLLGNASLKVDIFSWEAQKLLKDLGFDHYTFKEDREKIKMLLGEYQRLMTEDCRIPKDVTQLIISYYDGFDTRLLCFKKAKALGKFTYALTSVCKVQ